MWIEGSSKEVFWGDYTVFAQFRTQLLFMYGDFGDLHDETQHWNWVYDMFALVGSTFILFNLGIALMGGAYEEVTQNWEKLDYACLCEYLI